MYVLNKVSLPEKSWYFETLEELTQEFRNNHICSECKQDLVWTNDDGSKHEISNLQELLCTPCGLEYEVDDLC